MLLRAHLTGDHKSFCLKKKKKISAHHLHFLIVSWDFLIFLGAGTLFLS